MKKERVEIGGEEMSYPLGGAIHTGDICTAVINQREHICIWVRSRDNRSIFECVPIDFKVGAYLGPTNWEHSRYLGNIYELAGKA